MVRVLDVELYSFDIDKAVVDVEDTILSGISPDNRLISATGAHGIITARKDKQFREILTQFYINLPDGMPGVWVGRMKGAKEMKRCYGPEFFRSLLISSAGKPIQHFFCGGKEGVADELKAACETKFGNQNIVGTFCPPFRNLSDEEMQSLGTQINNSGADIVWIGLSTPKQEKFAFRLKEFTKVNFIITVGAAFDFHTDNVKQAPAWVQKIGMEWFFRLLMEPKRLYKRYLEIVHLFIWYNIKDLCNNYFLKSKKKVIV